MKFDKAGIYDRRRTGKMIFLGVSAVAIILFLLVSNSLVKELAQQERERMKIWASATEKLAQANIDTDFDFLLDIISQNNSIPVLVADEDYTILDFRNFRLPEAVDSTKMTFDQLSDSNRAYLSGRLQKAGGGNRLDDLAQTNPHFIRVEVYHNTYQYIYYEDSILLKRLSLYPYIQLAVMIILAVIIYFAVVYTKKAEQNRVWAGLSKETAHQLGTPISSLMAWNELLKVSGAEKEVTDEIGKDIDRLSVIAERFSKIGSHPELRLEYVNEIVANSLRYMKSRISGKVNIILNEDTDDHGVMLSPTLFEWVMENLTKNAVDAIEGDGTINISTAKDKVNVWIEI
ncbi:MAG: ATP-binding protein, partial [Muribaculaceae bacterium]|nr:ATP-binding protein [Muribaculaceae bacterium]